ncbi:transposase [Kitasatospora sp. RG8]|nr:transposase [Kitasatospora sp. RG8]
MTGSVRNCQVMVMLTYAAPDGHTFIDRRLYLPAAWTGDRARCREAGVPDEVAFATKPQLATHMRERALVDGTLFAWVVADSGYGRDAGLRAFLHHKGLHSRPPRTVRPGTSPGTAGRISAVRGGPRSAVADGSVVPVTRQRGHGHDGSHVRRVGRLTSVAAADGVQVPVADLLVDLRARHDGGVLGVGVAGDVVLHGGELLRWCFLVALAVVN